MTTGAKEMAEATLIGFKSLIAHALKPIEKRVGDQANDLHNALLRVHAAASEMRRLPDRIEKANGIRYRGVYRDGGNYEPGDFCTFAGSLWHCDSSASGTRPGGMGWTLAVKSGQQK